MYMLVVVIEAGRAKKVPRPSFFSAFAARSTFQLVPLEGAQDWHSFPGATPTIFDQMSGYGSKLLSTHKLSLYYIFVVLNKFDPHPVEDD